MFASYDSKPVAQKRGKGERPQIYACWANDIAKNALGRYCGNKVSTTKYNILTFLPKNLFEQFRRIANFYFLCLAILQVRTTLCFYIFCVNSHKQIPGISPVSPLVSIVPLALVLFATAVKEAYEDYVCIS